MLSHLVHQLLIVLLISLLISYCSTKCYSVGLLHYVKVAGRSLWIKNKDLPAAHLGLILLVISKECHLAVSPWIIRACVVEMQL